MSSGRRHGEEPAFVDSRRPFDNIEENSSTKEARRLEIWGRHLRVPQGLHRKDVGKDKS